MSALLLWAAILLLLVLVVGLRERQRMLDRRMDRLRGQMLELVDLVDLVQRQVLDLASIQCHHAHGASKALAQLYNAILAVAAMVDRPIEGEEWKPEGWRPE